MAIPVYLHVGHVGIQFGYPRIGQGLAFILGIHAQSVAIVVISNPVGAGLYTGCSDLDRVGTCVPLTTKAIIWVAVKELNLS